MKKVLIVDGKRTAIGKFNGTLKNINCATLGSTVVRAMLETNHINPNDVEEVIIGNVLSAGQGQGIARQVQILTGIPVETCAYSVNMVCGSSMKAVINGVETIRVGSKDCVIAGGVENMSQSPYLVSSNVRRGTRMGDFNLIDGMIADSLTDAFSGNHMGITAENLAEHYNISRIEQDTYAFESQKKALCAIELGEFNEEIIPIEVNEKKETIFFREDEYPNKMTSLEKLGGGKTCF